MVEVDDSTKITDGLLKDLQTNITAVSEVKAGRGLCLQVISRDDTLRDYSMSQEFHRVLSNRRLPR